MPDSLDGVVEAVRKRFGADSITRFGEGPLKSIQVLPTGSLGLDIALGVGGYPRGRIVEVFGPESSGKTTLALHAIQSAQAAGLGTAIVDAEHALDMTYARNLGVDISKLLVSQPDNGEQGLEIVDELVSSGNIGLVVVDSVAALVPKAELEGDMGASHMGLQARLMSQALRKLTAQVSRSGAIVLFVNQLRMKIGVMYGSPEVTTGGNALKYYASVRLDVRRVGKATEGEDQVGNQTKVKVVKNKVAPPFTEAEFDIIWGQGIDRVADLMNVAISQGLIERAGAWFSFAGGDKIAQGFNNAVRVLSADAAAQAELRSKVLAKAFG